MFTRLDFFTTPEPGLCLGKKPCNGGDIRLPCNDGKGITGIGVAQNGGDLQLFGHRNPPFMKRGRDAAQEEIIRDDQPIGLFRQGAPDFAQRTPTRSIKGGVDIIFDPGIHGRQALFFEHLPEHFRVMGKIAAIPAPRH